MSVSRISLKSIIFAGVSSRITLGIAGADIDDDIHAGNWHGSVGYKSTGQCTSSHLSTSQAELQQFSAGKNISGLSPIACRYVVLSIVSFFKKKLILFILDDTIGVLVTHFGETVSTVIFLKNGFPVATRQDFPHFAIWCPCYYGSSFAETGIA